MWQSYLVMAGSQGAACRSSVCDKAEFSGCHLMGARQYRGGVGKQASICCGGTLGITPM